MLLFDLPGAIYEAGREWLSWSGRYTYHFLSVFLGHAPLAPRPLYAFICFLPVFILTAALWLLLRTMSASPLPTAAFICLAILSLYATYFWLPNLYLLTDALTIVLQFSLYILFFYTLVAYVRKIKNGMPEGRPRKSALIAGIAAIGTYEHALLAVFWTCAAVLAGAILKNRNTRMIAALASLSGWLAAAMLFSLFAPGNFIRSQTRKLEPEIVRLQLGNVLPDWLHILHELLASPIPLCGIALGVLTAAFASRHKNCQLTALLSIAAYLFFSISVAFSQALSDASIASSPKFSASLGLYACFALALFTFACGNLACRTGKAGILISAGVLIAVAAASRNFQHTAQNIFDGNMESLAGFMERRETWLKKLATENKSPLPDIGLSGEIKDPQARSRIDGHGQADIQVQAIPRNVFPVYMQEALSAERHRWPNKWAAWVYGTGSIRAVLPDATQAVLHLPDEGLELRVPEGLFVQGLRKAYKIHAQGQNITFYNTWLVLEFADEPPELVSVFMPTQTEEGRLMPEILQAFLLERLLEKKIIKMDFLEKLSGVETLFTVAAWRFGQWCAFPLGDSPLPLFISLYGHSWYKLEPYLR